MDCHRVGLIGFTLVLAAAALLHGATAATFVVLDGEGWNIPANATAYSAWAANKDFKVGDVLVFNFPTNAHDVTKVTATNYANCGKTNPISRVTTGPASVTLETVGMHYFICTVGPHCTSGQKLAVTVTANSSTTTPPPPPTTTTSPPPPPRPSSASSITFGGFSAAILSMVLVFLH